MRREWKKKTEEDFALTIWVASDWLKRGLTLRKLVSQSEGGESSASD
jgi:hypothetical protein